MAKKIKEGKVILLFDETGTKVGAEVPYTLFDNVNIELHVDLQLADTDFPTGIDTAIANVLTTVFNKIKSVKGIT